MQKGNYPLAVRLQIGGMIHRSFGVRPPQLLMRLPSLRPKALVINTRAQYSGRRGGLAVECSVADAGTRPRTVKSSRGDDRRSDCII